MLLVDTSVWIDFFANRSTAQVAHLVSEINRTRDICICGPILTEVLQGIQNEKEYKIVASLFNKLLFLSMSEVTFTLAANIYRQLRKRGTTIRKTMDCMIAAVAIENQISFLHNDRDFEPIAKYFDLSILRATV